MHTFGELSEKLLLAVKKQEDTTHLLSEMEHIPFKRLQEFLHTDSQKKAFWINCYNAYFLILRVEKKISKSDIYSKKLINIAGVLFSLDDIEHGILRKYRYKFSRGFLGNLFASRRIKQLAVNAIDYRIHFALNCGAESCPPIAFYNAEELDTQLNIATQAFLMDNTIFNEQQKTVAVTRLFHWYLGDFGSFKGIRKIYKSQLGKDISDYKIVFQTYSWKEHLFNFK
ncbi:DUF547 domain-containing protein [Tenacibaculum amylolyticum]|uniref:DUF547 domain-containing protein n=1 Tax=Tenacibaculum amylolyticum TaxID=104269 RepID=UPI00389364F3